MNLTKFPETQVNRNKKSLALFFQHEAGIKILHDLVRKSDVVVGNYIPGSLKKYELDYPTLRDINPGLIYASITGYGQSSNRAGYDVMIEAELGLMHVSNRRGESRPAGCWYIHKRN